MRKIASRLMRLAAVMVGCVPVFAAGVALAEDAGPVALPTVERAYRASRVYAAALTYFAHWAGRARRGRDRLGVPRLPRGGARERGPGVVHPREHAVPGLRSATATRSSSTPSWRARAAVCRSSRARVAGRWVVTAQPPRRSCVPGTASKRSTDGRSRTSSASCGRMISASTEQWAPRAPFMRMPGMAPYTHLLPERFVLGLADGRRVAVDRRAMPDLPIGGTGGALARAGEARLRARAVLHETRVREEGRRARPRVQGRAGPDRGRPRRTAAAALRAS